MGTGSREGQGAREIRDESGGGDDGVRVVLATEMASNGLARDVVATDDATMGLVARDDGAQNDGVGDEGAKDGESRLQFGK